jgi:DNA-directed RNA polymerase subunit RPC12/RpoP
MAMVTVKCPSCGGKVQIEKEMTSGFCVHCGGRIVNEQKTGSKDPVKKDSELVSHLKMAKETLGTHDWQAASGLVDSILLIDADCQDAWYMKALLRYRSGTSEEMIEKAESGGMNSYGIFSKEDISEIWGELSLKVVFEFSKRTSVNMKARVTLDDKESVILEKGESTFFGTDPGKHEISVVFVIKAGDTAGDKMTFIAVKDHEFVIKTAAKGMMILNLTPKLVQLY